MQKHISNLIIASLVLAVLVFLFGQIGRAAGLGPVVPNHALLLCLLWFWAGLTGMAYAAAPEAGGLLAGFGHMTLFIMAIATVNPQLGPNLLVDSVRLSNAMLGLTAGAALLAHTFKRGAVVVSMLGWTAAGALAGGALSSLATIGAESPKMLHLFYGAYLTALAVLFGRRYAPRGQLAAEREKRSAETLDQAGGPVEMLSSSLGKSVFAYGGVEFAFRPMTMLALGLGVGLFTPLLGVGGFIFLPLFARAAQLPVRLVLPATASAVSVACLVQIAVFVWAGVAAPKTLIAVEAAGLLAGFLAMAFQERILARLNPHRIFLAPAAYFAARSLLFALFDVRLWP